MIKQQLDDYKTQRRRAQGGFLYFARTHLNPHLVRELGYSTAAVLVGVLWNPEEGNQFSVRSIHDLTKIPIQTIRTAFAKLSERGVLTPTAKGRLSSYSLATDGLTHKMLSDMDHMHADAGHKQVEASFMASLPSPYAALETGVACPQLVDKLGLRDALVYLAVVGLQNSHTPRYTIPAIPTQVFEWSGEVTLDAVAWFSSISRTSVFRSLNRLSELGILTPTKPIHPLPVTYSVSCKPMFSLFQHPFFQELQPKQPNTLKTL